MLPNKFSDKVRVLIVDDSAVVRESLTKMLSSDPDIDVIGTAQDPYMAAKKIKQEVPDVITLDVEMPKMDGITFLRKIMAQHPIPVVMISTLTARGTETALAALDSGAVEVLQKPDLHDMATREDARIMICDKVKAASLARIKRKQLPIGSRGRRPESVTQRVPEKKTADAMMARPTGASMIRTTDKIVAVGASTGGTEALQTFLQSFPVDSPPIVIVQHMPELFTKQFAERLNDICLIEVKEASNGDTAMRGRALIAPGNKHMMLKRSGAKYYVEIAEGPLVNRHRPSVDVLFRSVARYAGKNAVGAIMTGMGNDGAQGMLEMKQSGASTIAQDERTSVVFGMPHEAIKLKAVDKVLPIYSIATEVMNICHVHSEES